MKSVIIIYFSVLITLNITAQTITIRDKETRQPLENVTLFHPPTQLFAVTDKNGQADISKFKGLDKIEIRLLGYKTITANYNQLKINNFKLSLTLTGIPLNEMVISANRFEENKNKIVQKIQIIRRSDLEQMNQTSTADVLANSGNVMVQKSQQGGGSPIIRGFEANKVLLVVDGVRMNNAIYRGGHLQNVITLDNAIMERVELVYGPGSVVYGSDALGGVVHFYTKNPVLSKTDTLLVKTNTYTRYFSAASGYAAHTDVSVGGKKFGSLSSVTYSKFGDLRQGAVRNPFYGNFGARTWYVKRINNIDSVFTNTNQDIQTPSGYNQYDFLQKFMFQSSEKVTHILNLQYSTSSDVSRYDRLTQLSGNNPKYAEWYYGPQKRLFTAYTLQLNHKNKFYDRAQIILGFQNIEESRHTRRYRIDWLNHRTEQLNIFTLNVDFDKEIKKHDFRYGIDAWWNSVKSTAYSENIVTKTTTALDTRYPNGGSVMYSVAAYATNIWKITNRLTLNEGVRLTHIGLSASFKDKTFFPFPFNEVVQNNTALNGNLGIIYRPAASWKLFINVSSGFRAPNVDDIGKVFDSNPGNVIIPNPDIKPERTYTGDLGFEKLLWKSVKISTTGYYTLYTNALTIQSYQFNGQDSIIYDGQLSRVNSATNAGKAYIYGVEGMLSGNLNEYLSIVGTVNYTYGRIITDTTDYPLAHIPPVFGKFGINISNNRFKSEFFINYSSWKRIEDYNLFGEDNFSNATPYGMPAWFTLNARLNYQISKTIHIQIACENILDQNYRVFASNISAPGRNFIVTLRIK